MKLQNDHQFTTSGTITGEKVALTIDETAHMHLMEQLTELYSEPAKACVREYATNGRDAHVEAGITRPIEVTTPSPLGAATLTIRDYGLGLDSESVRSIYSKYGASTKRNSDDFNGMLGFGCKAALAYTNQFTVASVKDGVRTQILCSRDEDGMASMTILYEGPSDDPSGTEVSIPAKRGTDFQAIAEDFFQDWPEGSVLLNGVAPPRREGIKVNDQFTIIENDRYSRDGNLVVMGGVAYPAQFTTNLAYGHAVVAHVPIGTVSIAPSREALKYTERTNRAMENLAAAFSQAARGFAQNYIDAQGTHVEARRAAEKMGAIFGRAARAGGYTYRGQEIPRHIEWPDGTVQASSHSGTLSRHERDKTTYIHTLDQALVFTGYDKPNFTATHKKKLLQWLGNHPAITDVRMLVLVPAKRFQSEWIESSRVFKWEDVNAEVLPKKQRLSSGKPAGAFNIITENGHKYDVLAADFDTAKPMYYVVGRYGDASNRLRIAQDLAPKGFTLVYMGANREVKFCRDFPAAKEITACAQEAFNAWAQGLSEDDKYYLAMTEHGGGRQYARLSADRVDDPALKRAIRMSQREDDALYRRYRQYQYMGLRLSLPSAATNPLSAYPLYNSALLSRCPDQLFEYLNWQYSKRANSVDDASTTC